VRIYPLIFYATPFQINDEPKGTIFLVPSVIQKIKNHLVPVCTRAHINIYMNI